VNRFPERHVPKAWGARGKLPGTIAGSRAEKQAAPMPLPAAASRPGLRVWPIYLAGFVDNGRGVPASFTQPALQAAELPRTAGGGGLGQRPVPVCMCDPARPPAGP